MAIYSSEFQRLRPGHLEHEDFAVADAARARDFDDAFCHFVGAIVADPDADFHLRQKSQAVFAADVAVEIPLLSAVAFGFTNDTGADIELSDGFKHRLRAKGPNYNRELFHVRTTRP